MKEEIITALKELRVPCSIVGTTDGPQVMSYRLEPGYVPYASKNTPPRRVSVKSIINAARDISIAIDVSCVYIREDNGVWLEVPKENRSTVTLDDVGEPRNYTLPVRLGLTTRGSPVSIDLANPISPHLLVAGATGSGKSVCINSVICGLVERYTPNELQLILIDPKRIELARFKELKHLKRDVITSVYDAENALKKLIRQMELRYENMERYGYTDISQADGPRIVVVIDEYADLVLQIPLIPLLVAKLAQKGRAAGIHLVLATQRPSVDVIDGVIKANFPARIAFSVATNTDSRVILDRSGAERLTGMGDGLLLLAGKITRFQGAFVDDDSIGELVEKNKRPARDTSDPRIEYEYNEKGFVSKMTVTPSNYTEEKEDLTKGYVIMAVIAIALIACVACGIKTF